MQTVPGSLEKIRDALVLSTSSLKVDQNGFNRKIYTLLCDSHSLILCSTEKYSLNTEISVILEEVWNNKKLVLNRSMNSLLLSIISKLIKLIPGFVIRNILTSASNVCNAKSILPAVRENVLATMSIIVENRISDCASQSLDVFQSAIKHARAVELSLRLNVVQVLRSLVVAGNGKLSDMYMEIYKNLQKLITDKHDYIRTKVLEVIEILIQYSDNFVIITADQFLTTILRYLEDESAKVQNAAARTLGTLYE
jgi:hypothetical protein